jgi:hypothetical protein
LWIPPDDVLFRTGRPIINLTDYIKGLEKPKETSKEVRRFGRLGRGFQDMRHVFLSGCLPEEVSWDAKFSQGFHGAMTYNFAEAVLRAWKNREAITYREAHKAACQGLESGNFDQTPQLEGSENLKDSPVFGLSF